MKKVLKVPKIKEEPEETTMGLLWALDKTEGPPTECITLQATSTQPDLETGYRQGAMFSLEVTNDYSQEVDNS